MAAPGSSEERFKDVHPADALDTLSRRQGSSRTLGVVIGVAGLIVLALVGGLIWRTVSGGVKNAPTVPSVHL